MKAAPRIADEGMTTNEHKTALIVGASKGLGLAMVAEFLRRGWRVVATVRAESGTQLHALDAHERLEIEVLDMTVPEQITALRDRLPPRRPGLLLGKAGAPAG